VSERESHFHEFVRVRLEALAEALLRADRHPSTPHKAEEVFLPSMENNAQFPLGRTGEKVSFILMLSLVHHALSTIDRHYAVWRFGDEERWECGICPEAVNQDGSHYFGPCDELVYLEQAFSNEAGANVLWRDGDESQ